MSRARIARTTRANLPDDPEALATVLEDHSVFGRVSPQQKRAIVGALQRRQHVVAMTGDGVNDALALKDADIGIAMGSGAPATRAVAQVVLLDGRFASMPSVVAEGRRVIANVERVANLFVTKTVYAMILAVVIGVARWPYPFLPRHLTIVSSLTIGIPAFFLALAPNPRRYVPGFVRRVVLFAGPAGAVAAASTFVSYAIARHYDASDIAKTAATITLLIVGLWVLNLLARPITPGRALLFGAMVGAFAVILGVPGLRGVVRVGDPAGRRGVGRGDLWRGGSGSARDRLAGPSVTIAGRTAHGALGVALRAGDGDGDSVGVVIAEVDAHAAFGLRTTVTRLRAHSLHESELRSPTAIAAAAEEVHRLGVDRDDGP